MSTSVLQRLWAEYGQALEDDLQSRLERTASARTFSGMMRYALGFVDQRLRPDRAPSGKRFRPLLCLLTCEASGGQWRDALPAAAAIELLHNFSLIHDDVEDDDPTRRHRPSVWAVWGKPHAINVGDGMFAAANRALLQLELPAAMVTEVAAAFAEVALELTEGQYLDMSFEQRGDVTVGEYLTMITLKSAALIAFSAWCGTALAGAPRETREALRAFGLEAGKAFQIHDDMLGIWAGSSVTGKEVAKDLKNHKKTLPILLAAERASGADLLVLQRYLRGEAEDVDEVVRVLDAAGARAECQERLRRHLELARASLRGSALPPRRADELVRLADELTAQ